jgi:hypothetical protein
VGLLPPDFFSSENSSGNALALSKIEILGGHMVRPRSQNLALPISDFAPPSMPDCNHCKIGETMGQF